MNSRFADTRWGLVAKSASAILALLGACRATGSSVTGPSSSGAASIGSPNADASALRIAPSSPDGASNFSVADKIPDGAERVYRGTIGPDLAVIMRLKRPHPGAVIGRYFYEKKGVDLDLRGTLTEDGHIALDERASSQKITGHFEGALDKTGAVTGTWSDEARLHPLPFRLEPSVIGWAPGNPVPLFKKRVHLVRKPEQPGTSPLLKECSFDAAYPEVDGVFEPEVEARINAKLHINIAVPDPRCDTAESNELSYAVSLNRAGILSVVFDNNWCCGAHPAYSRELVNLTIPDAEVITLAGLLQPNARPKLTGLLRPLIAKLGEGEAVPDGELLEQLTKKPAEFSIEDKGLRLTAFNSQPHVIQSMFAEGFLIPYSKLTGLLKVPGPLDPLLAPPR